MSDQPQYNPADPNQNSAPQYPENPQGQPAYGEQPQQQYGQAPYNQAPEGGYPGYQQPGQYQYGYQEQPMYADQKSKLAAGLFGIFLGSLGVHNFYLGYTGKAVAQLLITVLSLGILAPVSALWGLIEGILILAAQPGSSWSFDARGVPLRQ